MSFREIFFIFLILFFVIFFAVRMAIRPLLPETEEEGALVEEEGLNKLRDIGVFKDEEIYTIIGIFSEKGRREKEKEQFQKYVRVLSELKEMGYLDEEAYEKKMEKLRSYYKE